MVNPVLAEQDVTALIDQIGGTQAKFSATYPGYSALHQPVHTLYGGAHLFSADTHGKLSRLAQMSFEQYAEDKSSFQLAFDLKEYSSILVADVYDRILRKLSANAIEDIRIDFEDGYGFRSDPEEDRDAIRTGEEVAKARAAGTLSSYCGIRIKPLDRESGRRAIRTLDLFIGSMRQAIGAPRVPTNFVVALPKVFSPLQVQTLAKVLSTLEQRHRLERDSIKIELMIEQPQTLIDSSGKVLLLDLVRAGDNRVRGVHFGAYDYTAACGVVASDQYLGHSSCDFARNFMQVALAQTGVWLSDGATTILPTPPHRASESLSPLQKDENTRVVHNAWRLHFRNVLRACQSGYFQGWDLHPAQIPARYAALYVFFLTRLPEMSKRLRAFVEQAGKATLTGDIFDDAATGQGLLNYFLRAYDCGAITEADLKDTGLALEDLRLRSFREIVNKKRTGGFAR